MAYREKDSHIQLKKPKTEDNNPFIGFSLQKNDLGLENECNSPSMN